MSLIQLNALNAQVNAQLKSARLNLVPVAPSDDSLATMKFSKPDHSAIEATVPLHKIALAQDNQALNNDSDYVNAVVGFVLNAANEFENPTIHLKPLYLTYHPKMRIKGWATLCFDIAIWEYDQQSLRWMELKETEQGRKVHDSRYTVIQVKEESHKLQKTAPFEVNLWTSNIVRDVAKVTKDGGSTYEYMTQLEKKLLIGARNAAEALHKMQRAASVQDVVNTLYHKNQFSNAALVVGEALKTEVSMVVSGIEAALLINGSLYRSDQVFALLAGIPVKGVEYQERSNFWKYSEQTPEEVELAGLIFGTKPSVQGGLDGRH